MGSYVKEHIYPLGTSKGIYMLFAYMPSLVMANNTLVENFGGKWRLF